MCSAKIPARLLQRPIFHGGLHQKEQEVGGILIPQNAPPHSRPARSVVRRLFPKENESFLASTGLLWSGEMRDECAHALLIVGPSGRRYVNRENTVATARASLTITSATWFGNRPGTHWNRAAAACHPRRRADARPTDPKPVVPRARNLRVTM